MALDDPGSARSAGFILAGGLNRPASRVAILRTVSRIRLSACLLAPIAIVFLLADWGDTMVGSSFFPGGLLDETAHLLTMLIVLWALPNRAWERYGPAALVASVAIDLDHVPQYLGDDFLTRGTPRPYSHALLTVVVILLLAALWRRRRDVFLGIALGLSIHFWRDLSEPRSGVALLWPLTDHSFSLSPASYLVVLALLLASMPGGAERDAASCGRSTFRTVRCNEAFQAAPTACLKDWYMGTGSDGSVVVAGAIRP